MIRTSGRLFFRFAVVGAVALALAGCGRKGALDLPPGAAVDASSAVKEEAAPATLIDSMSGKSSKPVAPQGQNKRIPLDALLN